MDVSALKQLTECTMVHADLVPKALPIMLLAKYVLRYVEITQSGLFLIKNVFVHTNNSMLVDFALSVKLIKFLIQPFKGADRFAIQDLSMIGES